MLVINWETPSGHGSVVVRGGCTEEGDSLTIHGPGRTGVIPPVRRSREPKTPGVPTRHHNFHTVILQYDSRGPEASPAM